MSLKILPKHYNYRSNPFIKSYSAEIKQFKYCIEISFNEYENLIFSYRNYKCGLDIDNMFFCIFFNGKKGFIDMYKKQLSEEDLYYVNKSMELDIFSDLNIAIDTNEFKRTKIINFFITGCRINFQDKELDKYNGDVERLLKIRKIAKNIEGF